MSTTPCLSKAIYGPLAGVRAAIEQGADVDQVLDSGGSRRTTPLALAMRIGAPGTPELLLEHGADANLRDPESRCTPLRLAVSLRSPPSVFKVLLEYGADPCARSGGGSGSEEPVLHSAIASGISVAVLELLLSAGADVFAVDRLGRTALHRATAYSQNLEVILLLECHWAGRTVLSRDCSGRTPIDSRLRSLEGDSLLKDLQRMRGAHLRFRRTMYGNFAARQARSGAGAELSHCHDFEFVLVKRSSSGSRELFRYTWGDRWASIVECKVDTDGGGVDMKFQDEKLVLEFLPDSGAAVVRHVDLCRMDLETEIARLRDKYTSDVPGI